MHPRLIVRFGALLTVAAVTFLVGWTLAYLCLPGYLGTVMVIAQAAVVTGTNSFSIQSRQGKLAPTLEVLAHPGPYELAAYVLAATAGYSLGRWQLVGRWPHQTAPRIAAPPPRRAELFVGVAAATVMLAGAAAWETAGIMAAVG